MKIILFLSAGILISISAFTQTNKPIQTFNQLADSISKIAEQEHIVGLTVGIATKDSVLFSGGFGYADIGAKRKVDNNTLFRMGSITKMMVALAVMKLVEKGRLNLTDELKIIAPEVPFQNKWETTNPVLIVHLLEHTSGFDDVKLNAMYSLSPKENNGIEMMLVHKNSMVCRWKPGERTAYSNPNYAILGYIIEKLTHKPYDQYLTEIILDPLGMKDTNFNLKSKMPEDVKEYIYDDGRIKLVPSVTLLSGPQGALWSSASDMIKFLQLFLRSGDPLFSENIINEMELSRSSLGARSGLTSGYGLGNSISFIFARRPFRGHLGITGTCHSGLYYNRKLNAGFVIASNSDHSNFRIENLIVSFLLRNNGENNLVAESLDQRKIEPFIGWYQFESPRNEIASVLDKFQGLQKIYIKNGTLFSKPLFGNPTPLIQTAPLTFSWKHANTPMIVFTKNDDHQVMCIGGSYFEKVPYGWALTRRIALSVSVILAFSSFIFFIVSLIGPFAGKVKYKDLVIHSLPMFGLVLLIWSISSMLEVQRHSYLLSELNTVTQRSLLIFVGTSAFGTISCLSLFYAIRKFRLIRNRWLAWYLIMLSSSFLVLTLVLLQSGWMGLMTWAM